MTTPLLLRLRQRSARISNRLTTNTVVLLINNIATAGLSFLISVIIGRALGAQGLGQYAFIMAWIDPFVSFADFGMGSLLTRDVAKNRADALPLLRTANRALLPIAGLILIAAYGLMSRLQVAPVVSIALPIAALLILLDPWYGLYTALFRAIQQMWPILALNVIGFLLQLGFTVLVIALSMGLIGVIVVLIAVNVIQLALTWILWRRIGVRASSITQGSSPTLRSVIRRAWPFALAAVLITLQSRLNILMLEQRAGDISVGIYSAANRFVEAARLIPGALFGALFPALASLVAQPERMRRVFLRSAGLIAAFAILFALCMMVFGGWLIHITYDPKGENFTAAEPILILLAWSLLPSLLRSVITLYLYSMGREHLVNRITVFALMLQAGTGWLLIGAWGVLGAAITILIVEGTTTTCLTLAMVHTLRRSNPGT